MENLIKDERKIQDQPMESWMKKCEEKNQKEKIKK